MADFLLIHGSCHTSWSWHLVAARLSGMGHDVRSIDLPGIDAADTSLDACARAIMGEMGEETVLVAHSAGGYPATAAAMLVPDRCRHLIFVAGYVPKSGKSLADRRREFPIQLLIPHIRKTEDGRGFSIDPEAMVKLFYHDVPPDLAADACRHLRVQPIAPQETPLDLSLDWAGLAKSYIQCNEDRAVPPLFQAVMAEACVPRNRHVLRSSHSPFLSMPDRLSVLLHEIIEHST